MINRSVNIHFAPLQNLTDSTYIKTFKTYFDDINFFYTPYIVCENDGTIKKKHLLELDKNSSINITPQILPSNINETIVLTNAIIASGYLKININMGCPYPMVINKGRGSALIQNLKVTENILNYIEKETNLEVSIKTRLGIENTDKIEDLLELITNSKVTETIVHCRIAKQLYKGASDILTFKRIHEKFPNLHLIYNGDINAIDDFAILEKHVGVVDDIMIGRGLLSNPYLAWQIKNDSTDLPPNHENTLIHFIVDLINNIINDSNNTQHAINRIKIYSEYFCRFMPNGKKSFKMIKKAKSLPIINAAIKMGFN